MERPPVFTHEQNSYLNDNLTKSYLQIWQNHHVNPNDIPPRNRNDNPKLHMEIHKTTQKQRNPEQINNVEGITIPDFKLCCRVIVRKKHSTNKNPKEKRFNK
jgi:hypothetical protein